ncbi:MAG: hypothetical protein ACYSYL_18075, partial [Planctomycetota bacterium]
KDILERHEQLRSELNALKSSTESRINVAAIYSIGMHTLPDYIKKFMVKYPKVNVNIEYFRAIRIYELILAGDADIDLRMSRWFWRAARNILYLVNHRLIFINCSLSDSSVLKRTLLRGYG